MRQAQAPMIHEIREAEKQCTELEDKIKEKACFTFVSLLHIEVKMINIHTKVIGM